MNKKLLFGIIFLAFGMNNANSQGCSDAGFCSMGAMKPDQPFNKKINLKLRSLELSFYRGQTTLTPVIYSVTADMGFSLNARNSFQVKVPYMAVMEGSLGETSGLSDLSLSYTRNLLGSEKYDLNFSIGTKIPTNGSNLEEDGKPLPMYYQTSLGTFDFIAGMSFITRNWLFATGIQHAFNQNKNQFVWGEWPDYPNQDYLKKYPKSKELKRGTDIMLRAEYNIRFSRLNFSIGALPIFRITRDEYFDPAAGERVRPEETTGMALSAIGTAGYSFNISSGIKFLYGRKITQRELNPDGLTRHDVLTVSYYYRF